MSRWTAALALSAALTTAAQAQAPQRSEVEALLRGYETMPSKMAWRRMGPSVLPELFAIYQDTTKAQIVRLRAVVAASYFPSEATLTFLRAIATAEDQHPRFVREAISGLARAFGGRALGTIRDFCEHENASVRISATRAIGRIGGPEARALLRQRLNHERSAEVRRVLESELSPERAPARSR